MSERQPAENEARREAAAIGWDAAVSAMKYEDGTPVEVVAMVNPYRAPMTCGDTQPHEPHRKIGDGRPCEGVPLPVVAARVENHWCLDCGSHQCDHAHASYITPPAVTDTAGGEGR